MARERIDLQGNTQPVSSRELLKLREQIAATSGTDYYTRWAKWFFADRGIRMVSPNSVVTIAEIVNRRVAEGTIESLEHAVRLAPANAVALSALASKCRETAARTNATFLARADLYERLAAQFMPKGVEAPMPPENGTRALGR